MEVVVPLPKVKKLEGLSSSDPHSYHQAESYWHAL